MQNLIAIAIPVLVGLILLGLTVFFISRLYRRATKETAFVRTGFRGQRVIKDGGALVFPVLHETIPVNMTTLRITVERKLKGALITKDSMRADVTAEFYVRVKPDEQAIADAAQTLGSKTMEPENLKQLIEGKFVDALRSVAATSDMQELHEKRTEFVQKVREVVAGDILKNGLELESVSLTGLDQTNKNDLDVNNAFDAVGLAKLTKIIESRRKEVNDTEQENRLLIAQRNLETKQRTIEIERQEEYAQIELERDVANRRAEATTAAALVEAERNREAEEARLAAKRHIDTQRLATEQNEATKTIEKQQAVALAEQARQIAIAVKSQDESRAKAEAEKARAESIRAEEQVETARATEVADRAKKIELIKASEKAERDAIGVTVQARAEKEAAENRAEAIEVEAKAKANADKIAAEGLVARYDAEAEGQRKLNEASNLLSPEIIEMRVKEILIPQLAGIVDKLVEPMRHIDSIKVIDIGGLGQGGSGSGAANDGSSGGLPDQIVNAALRQQAISPLMGNLLNAAGITDTKTLEGIAAPLNKMLGGSSTSHPAKASAVEPAAPSAVQFDDEGFPKNTAN